MTSTHPEEDETNFDPSDYFQQHRGDNTTQHNMSSFDALTGDNDTFFRLLYDYYRTGGMTCVVLSHASFLVRTLFTILFTALLTTCFDQGLIQSGAKLSSCSIKDTNNWVRVGVAVFLYWWAWAAWRATKRVRRMFRVKRVWEGNLGLPSDVRFVSWPLVMKRYQERVNGQASALHIVNRIMRWDNYFIAMLTKDVLGLHGNRFTVFSKVLEWHLRTSIRLALFRNDGMLIQDVMLYARRKEYVDRLKTVFRRSGIFALLAAPFLFIAFVVYFAYRHVSEYHKNPQAIAAHCFTPLARWKLRDFNELPHVYLQRLQACHSRVKDFLAQFSSEALVIISRCLSFLMGATLLVLVTASLLNADATLTFLGLEKPVLFYTGIVGALFVALQRESPDDLLTSATLSPDPDARFEELARTLRCMPYSWKNMTAWERYNEVRELFRFRWEVFLPELLSVITLPFILLFHCPKQASNIVSFLRENSVHVDHMGIICSCAMLAPIQKRMTYGSISEHDPTSSAMDEKMRASIANFNDNYPLCQTDSYLSSPTASDDAQSMPPPATPHAPPDICPTIPATIPDGDGNSSIYYSIGVENQDITNLNSLQGTYAPHDLQTTFDDLPFATVAGVTQNRRS